MTYISFEGVASIVNIILSFILITNIILAATIVFLERRHVAATWAWLLILLFIPIVGFIVYVIFGQNLSKRKLFKLMDKHEDEFNERLHKQVRALEQNEAVFNDRASERYQSVIRLNIQHGKALFSQNNRITIFKDGEAKFAEVLQDIEAAKHHIHMLYYIYKRGYIGEIVRDALVAKAKQEVKVRVIIDDMGSSRLPRSFFRSLIEAGGEVALFFPSKLLPYLNFRVNYRNHRKIIVIDGQIGYLGGINIGDEYLGRHPKFGYWRDTHMKLTGNAVDALQFRFLLDWSQAAQTKFGVDETYFPPVKRDEGEVGMQIVSSGPDSESERIKDGIIKLIYASKESIYIQTPYFVPDESMMHAIKIAVKSGVDVRIMLPNKPDHIFVHWASLSHVGELLPLGVRVFEYEKGFMHAKTIVVDGRAASVGTANFDVRSFKLNFEANAFIFETSTATELHNLFIEDMAHSKELTYALYQKRSLSIRFKESISRLLSPIL